MATGKALKISTVNSMPTGTGNEVAIMDGMTFTAPHDGYLRMGQGSTMSAIKFFGTYIARTPSAANEINAIFVHKGTVITREGSGASIIYYPLI